MAVYVLIKKISEDEDSVKYNFGPNEEKMGVIEFNRKTNKFYILEQVNDGLISNEAYENWTIQKLVRTFMKENDVFSERIVAES